MTIDTRLFPIDANGIIPTAQGYLAANIGYSPQLVDNINRLFYQFSAKYLGQVEWSYGPLIKCTTQKCAYVAMIADLRNPSRYGGGLTDGHAFLTCEFDPKTPSPTCGFMLKTGCVRNSLKTGIDCSKATGNQILLNVTNEKEIVPGFQEDPFLSKTFRAIDETSAEMKPTNLTIKGVFQTLVDAIRAKYGSCLNQYPIEHFCLSPTLRVRIEDSFINFLEKRLDYINQGELTYRLIHDFTDSKNLVASLSLTFNQKGTLPDGDKTGVLQEVFNCGNLLITSKNLPFCEFRSTFRPDGTAQEEMVQPNLQQLLTNGSLAVPAPTLLRKPVQESVGSMSKGTKSDASHPSAASPPKQAGAATGSTTPTQKGTAGGNTPGASPQASGPSSTGTPNPSQGASRFKLAALGVGALAVIAIAYKAFQRKDDSSEKRLQKTLPQGKRNTV